MELTDLGYFRHVALAGSFAEAARRAHVSGPAVSKAIKRLEQALEVPLFERTTRSVRLTDAGHLVLEHVERIFGAVSGLEQALDETHGVFKGPYRVAFPELLQARTVAPAVLGLAQLQPGMQPHLSWLEGSAAERALLDGQLDAAVRIGPPKSEHLEWRRIGTVRSVLVCSPEHPLASNRECGAPLDRGQLEAHPFVVTSDAQTGEPLDAFPREIADRSIGANVDRLSLAIDLVRGGQLLGLCPETSVATLLRSGELVELDPGFHVSLELCSMSLKASPIFKQLCAQIGQALAPEPAANVESLRRTALAPSLHRPRLAPTAE